MKHLPRGFFLENAKEIAHLKARVDETFQHRDERRAAPGRLATRVPTFIRGSTTSRFLVATRVLDRGFWMAIKLQSKAHCSFLKCDPTSSIGLHTYCPDAKISSAQC